jgi:hypothetical protein
MLSDYYRQRRGRGDPLVVHRHNGPVSPGIWPCRAPVLNGDPSSVQVSDCTSRFLSTCRKVDRRDIPEDWRRALDGPDSGLSEAAVQDAAQSLYGVVWADAWEEAGGEFRPGQDILDVCPAVPAAGVEVVRGWIRDLDAKLPYPLFDLFTSLGILDDDAGHGAALHYLCMGAIGHGVCLDDYVDDHCEKYAWDRADKVMKTDVKGPADDLSLDDWRLREVADEWVESHPPDPANPTEIPADDNEDRIDAKECKQCLNYVPRDLEDSSDFCSEDCRVEWETDNPAENP